MAVNGYLSVELNVKSQADQFYQTYMDIMDVSKEYGTVVIENAPFEMKKTTFIMTIFEISEWYTLLKGTVGVDTLQNPDWYRKLEGTLIITHVEGNDRDRAIWTLEYEKTSPEIEDPKSIMETFVEFFKDLDEFLLATFK